MKFSFIVPVYKTASSMRKCVDSILNQCYGNLELILINDGSPDEAPEICEEYARNDTRVHVIHKKNGGLSDARNSGLKQARGQYVFFVDSDDYIESNTCELFLPYVEQGYQIITGDARIEGNEEGVITHILSPDVMTGEEYLKQAYASHKAPMAACLNAYNRLFLQNNKLEFKYGILHEDEEFSPRVFLAATSVFCSGISFYHYSKRDGTITTKRDKRKNAQDLYQTLCALEKRYHQLTDADLKNYLLDSLAYKYLNMFQIGSLHRYGDEYLHKAFIKRNARCWRTILKSYFYSFSPSLYYFFNKLIKSIRSKKHTKHHGTSD